MRNIALMGLFAFAIFASISPKASAESLAFIQIEQREVTVSEPVLLANVTVTNGLEIAETPEPPKTVEPVVIKHKIVANDSLSKIAETYGTTWKRLFDKNVAISNPDLLIIGNELIVPAAEETLVERPLPEPPQPVATPIQPAGRRATAPAVKAAATPQVPGSSIGNRYTAGYCTWYVKNMRPSLPNNLGNASSWVANATAQGMATGSAPRVGAVGQRGNHVVYVEAVNGDGTVNISEMNHKGLYVRTERTLPASYFTYIY